MSESDSLVYHVLRDCRAPREFWLESLTKYTGLHVLGCLARPKKELRGNFPMSTSNSTGK